MITIAFVLTGRLPTMTGPTALPHHVVRLKEPTSVRDALESLGIPHTEVDLLLARGLPVDLNHRLSDGDQVEVHETPDANPDTTEGLKVAAGIAWAEARLQPRPLPHTRFVCDSHLGRLARMLRLLGFDTLYRRDWTEAALADTATREDRAILTCSRSLLMRKEVVRGRLVLSRAVDEQVREVIKRFGLASRMRPFSRCSRCNGETRAVPKAEVMSRIPLRTRAWCEVYSECAACGHLYWEGTHVERLRERIRGILGGDDEHE